MMPARSVPRVMLLIDADNVTADVIEQAVHHVLERHGAAHVRRAYCTSELAHRHLKLFKAHSIRPMINISTGKNSTDIALAVDAMDLVLSERPDVAVLVSSDSDFAPLVIRLREKGCRVEGIGQEGKTGDDSKPVYDDFVDIAHRKGRTEATADDGVAATGTRTPAARKAATKGASTKRTATAGRVTSRRGAAKTLMPAAAQAAPIPAPTAAPLAESTPAPTPAPPAARPAERSGPKATAAAAPEPSAPAAPARTRRGAANRSTAGSGASTRSAGAAPRPAAKAEPAVSDPAPREPLPPASSGSGLPDEVERILAALPELNYGARVQLNQARERLQAAGLLARSAPSTKLFRKHPALFALTPEKAPNKVQFLRPSEP